MDRKTARWWKLSVAVVASLSFPAGAMAQLSPGFRVYAPTGSKDAHMIDPAGVRVHTWSSGYFPGLACYLLDNGNLLRTINTALGPGGGSGGGVQELTFDGTVVWEYRYDTGGVLSHHDIEPLPNGNVLMLAWETRAPADAIAIGRNPATIGSTFKPDHVIEVQPIRPFGGTIVWQWHFWDHLVQDFDPALPNYAPVQDHPELLDINYPPNLVFSGDYNHTNAVDYDPIHDRIIISSLYQNEIYVIDHSTTTQEAAGHTGGNSGMGGDFLYRWGNPQAYRAGSASDQRLFSSHGAHFIPAGLPGAGNLLLFNNKGGFPGSVVWELVPPVDAQGDFFMNPDGTFGPAGPIWTWKAANLSSGIMSGAERMANGNTQVTNGTPGIFYEVDAAGTLLSEYSVGSNFKSVYTERSMWSSADTFSAAAGGSVALDLVGGSALSGSYYWVLGSTSGTSPGQPLGGGFNVPLNRDFYYVYTLNNPNAAPLSKGFGVLGEVGRGRATFSLPGGVIPASFIGTVMSHAWVGLDSTTLAVNHVSNAVGLTIVP